MSENPRRQSELDRAADEYRSRDADAAIVDRWSMLRPDVALLVQSRERAVLQALRGLGMRLQDARILDVGCGAGGELMRLMLYGAQPANCAGIDLASQRIEKARELLPAVTDVREGSADALPWPDASFDLVTQFTMLSSVLDSHVRADIAREMVRVCRPGGMILSYDMRRDFPLGRRLWPGVEADGRLHWFTREEMADLFSECDADIRSTTLSVVYGERVARSRMLYGWLDMLQFLHSHYLAIFRPRGQR